MLLLPHSISQACRSCAHYAHLMVAKICILLFFYEQQYYHKVVDPALHWMLWEIFLNLKPSQWATRGPAIGQRGAQMSKEGPQIGKEGPQIGKKGP